MNTIKRTTVTALRNRAALWESQNGVVMADKFRQGRDKHIDSTYIVIRINAGATAEEAIDQAIAKLSKVAEDE